MPVPPVISTDAIFLFAVEVSRLVIDVLELKL